MDVKKAIELRRSVRGYHTTPVPEEALEQILEAARLAPSWKNSQGFSVVVVRDDELKRQIGQACRNNPNESTYQNAPCLLILVADPQASGHRDDKAYYLVDGAIAMEHMMLQATALGLGTCWVGAFDEAPVKELLGIPQALRLVALTPLGYSAQGEIAPRPRRAMADMVHYDGWEAQKPC